jgi:hypothetical protein
MSNDAKLVSAIKGLSKEISRIAAAMERTRLASEKQLKSLDKLLNKIPLHHLTAGIPSGGKPRARRRAA